MELDKTSLIPHQHQSEIKEKEKKMKVNQQEQLLTELDSVLEEISDDNSACLTGGARSTFSATIPDVGAGLSRSYTTTSQFNDISIRLNQDFDFPIFVRAVRANGRGSVSTSSRRIPAKSKGDLIPVATNVRDGVEFRLEFLISTPNFPTFVSGPITF
ncbi:hypothetical protein LC612_22775 [Nostoc sp. CHAB 5834]|nr:hypothetical protein [Nostoc sp. CHAB 5834]